MPLVLGAPGIYRAPQAADHRYGGVRLDVAAFVGIAPRGPAREAPVARAVDSWSAYQQLYGGFEGPGRLPYAVASFFDQGGRRAYIVRVVPLDDSSNGTDATARHQLVGLTGDMASPVELAARNEGAWGNGLRITLELPVSREFLSDAPERATELDRVALPEGIELPAGSLLRMRCARFRQPAGVVRFVGASLHVERQGSAPPARFAVLDGPVPLDPAGGSGLVEVGVVTGVLSVEQRALSFPVAEKIDNLGLHPNHPRWLWRVLAEQSALVRPVGGWVAEPLLLTDPLLGRFESELAQDGHDVEHRIDIVRDVFAPRFDPLEEGRVWQGIEALAEIEEIGLLVLPDLFWSPPDNALPPPAPGPPCVAVFQPCPPEVVQAESPPPLGRLLDGSTVASFRELLARQRLAVEFTERFRRFVLLLDVPQRMPAYRIEQWRAAIDGSYVAAYHPWLLSERRDDRRDQLVAVPPSACAAGIIAERENRLGISWGPANELAAGATKLGEAVSDEMYDRLHQQSINVYRSEPRGIRLSAARTLSRDVSLRQLSVRRLMLLIRLTLERESHWAAFEPNNPALWAEMRWHLTAFLRQLYLGGAFKGGTEEEAFFVHCDERLNPASSLSLGRLIVEVGVCPAEPLEYLVLRIARSQDGSVTVEEARV